MLQVANEPHRHLDDAIGAYSSCCTSPSTVRMSVVSHAHAEGHFYIRDLAPIAYAQHVDVVDMFECHTTEGRGQIVGQGHTELVWAKQASTQHGAKRTLHKYTEDQAKV